MSQKCMDGTGWDQKLEGGRLPMTGLRARPRDLSVTGGLVYLVSETMFFSGNFGSKMISLSL